MHHGVHLLRLQQRLEIARPQILVGHVVECRVLILVALGVRGAHFDLQVRVVLTQCCGDHVGLDTSELGAARAEDQLEGLRGIRFRRHGCIEKRMSVCNTWRWAELKVAGADELG